MAFSSMAELSDQYRYPIAVDRLLGACLQPISGLVLMVVFDSTFEARDDL